MFYPSYFLMVDKQSQSIIFAIRGTSSLEDALTDLVAEPTPFFEGTAWVELGDLGC